MELRDLLGFAMFVGISDMNVDPDDLLGEMNRWHDAVHGNGDQAEDSKYVDHCSPGNYRWWAEEIIKAWDVLPNDRDLTI